MATPTASQIETTAGQLRPSQTAQIVCAQRAAETRRPARKRVIDDPYAGLFLSTPMYRRLCARRSTAALTRAAFDSLYGGYMGVVLLRLRYFDQALARARAEGINQIVLLGAGYDTTSLRVDLGDATLFEVDAPPTQLAKRAVIEAHGLRSRGTVVYAPCDFERDSLPQSLRTAGFDPNAASLIGWFGVSFFLTDGAVRQTLRDVAALSAPGSRFVFDYLHQSVVEGTTRHRGAARARAAVARRNEPYRFGLTVVGARELMGASGFAVEENLSIPQLAERFAPFPYRTDDFFGLLSGRRTGS